MITLSSTVITTLPPKIPRGKVVTSERKDHHSRDCITACISFKYKKYRILILSLLSLDRTEKKIVELITWHPMSTESVLYRFLIRIYTYIYTCVQENNTLYFFVKNLETSLRLALQLGWSLLSIKLSSAITSSAANILSVHTTIKTTRCARAFIITFLPVVSKISQSRQSSSPCGMQYHFDRNESFHSQFHLELGRNLHRFTRNRGCMIVLIN